MIGQQNRSLIFGTKYTYEHPRAPSWCLSRSVHDLRNTARVEIGGAGTPNHTPPGVSIIAHVCVLKPHAGLYSGSVKAPPPITLKHTEATLLSTRINSNIHNLGRSGEESSPILVKESSSSADLVRGSEPHQIKLVTLHLRLVPPQQGDVPKARLCRLGPACRHPSDRGHPTPRGSRGIGKWPCSFFSHQVIAGWLQARVPVFLWTVSRPLFFWLLT